MFANSDSFPFVMVAPNGARRGKSEHPGIPANIEEIRDETAACAAAGADGLHLHVRDDAGGHSLDTGRYREAMEEIQSVLPNFPIQVTTESAGVFDVEQQFDCLASLRPAAASISIREVARRADLAPKIYGLCEDERISVQHIVYNQQDWRRLMAWRDAGVIRERQDDVLFVLGTYIPPKAASRRDLQAWTHVRREVHGRVMVCAFGNSEHEVLCEAAAQGADLRVGFENNIHAQDGTLAESNAANVAKLKGAISNIPCKGVSP